MLHKAQLDKLNKNDLEEVYSKNSTLFESLVLKYYSDDVLMFCEEMSSDNINNHALRIQSFATLFNELASGKFEVPLRKRLKEITQKSHANIF